MVVTNSRAGVATLDDISLKKLVEQTLLLVKESADYQKSPEIGEVFAEASQTLVSLHRRLANAGKRYSVGVVGLTNVGKSTLLNAVFGSELAPRRNGPCTAAPIEFTYGQDLRVSVVHNNSMRRIAWNCATVEEVHERLSALADDAGAEQSRLIRKVVVEAPLPILDNGLIISDTPGFGAAQSEDAAGSHEEALKRYLTTELSQVFWVVLGEQGIGKREKDFHGSFFGRICDDIIVTGCEDWEDRDKLRFRKRFSDMFGQRLPQFHFVSGLQGHKARQANDQQQLEEAGIPALEDRIKSLANPAGRCQSIVNAYRQLGDDLHDWLTNGSESGQVNMASLWRPDSWDRWRMFIVRERLGEIARPFLGNALLPSFAIPSPVKANGLDNGRMEDVPTHISTTTQNDSPKNASRSDEALSSSTAAKISFSNRAEKKSLSPIKREEESKRKYDRNLKIYCAILCIAAILYPFLMLIDLTPGQHITTPDGYSFVTQSSSVIGSVMVYGLWVVTIIAGLRFGWRGERLTAKKSNWLGTVGRAVALTLCGVACLFVFAVGLSTESIYLGLIMMFSSAAFLRSGIVMFIGATLAVVIRFLTKKP